MTKIEFLNKLRNELKGLPQEDLENRLSFYEEMINDRMDEGKSEEQAVAEIGTVDEVVQQIAKETPFFKLVKQRTKPSRPLRGWEIALIIIGFPLWFPLLIVALNLCLVAYILIWTFVIVTYSLEAGFIGYTFGGIVASVASLAAGEFNLIPLGAAIASAGAAILLIFGCIGATKLSLTISKKIVLGIKTAFIRKGK